MNLLGVVFKLMRTLSAFSDEEARLAKLYLAGAVAAMMGRKLEEGDWSAVYCKAKGIPDAGWSNLNIDINYNGLGLELKLLRISSLGRRSIRDVCGTALMHPSATRSIRIDNVNVDPDVVMRDILTQYGQLISDRTNTVRAQSPSMVPDMRTGWLLWEDNLAEFLYFEESMVSPDPNRYYATWNDTPARGARKPSRSLWIYDKATGKKCYSVTTSAGIKIQPYFDVPAPTDPNLCFFRVQGEPVDSRTTLLWVTYSTAQALTARLGNIAQQYISGRISALLDSGYQPVVQATHDEECARAIPIDTDVYNRWVALWAAKSDEHRALLLLKALQV